VFTADGAQVVRTRSDPQGRTASLSAGCGPSGRSVWTGRSSWVDGTWSGCSTSTWLTTTPSAHTAGWISGRQTLRPIRPRVRPTSATSGGATSWAGSSTSTNSLHDGLITGFRAPHGPAVMDDAIQDALISKHRSRSRAGESTRTTAGAGSTRAGRAKGQLRHAGPRWRAAPCADHRGREGTRALASAGDQQAAERRRAARDRPNDPTMQERYGV